MPLQMVNGRYSLDLPVMCRARTCAYARALQSPNRERRFGMPAPASMFLWRLLRALIATFSLMILTYRLRRLMSLPLQDNEFWP